jgi:RNA polymerase sigma factor (sigma-70 family)
VTKGETARFAVLYQKHQRHIYAYCRRRVAPDTVDDVVADVYLTLWRRIGDAPRDDDEARLWLYRIASLVTTNHWRGSSRRRNLKAKLESLGTSPGVSIPEQIVMREEVRDALTLLDKLSASDREIIKLSIWEYLSNGEIATVLGIEPNAVRQRLHRAKKRLAQEFEKHHKQITASPAAQEGGEW